MSNGLYPFSTMCKYYGLMWCMIGGGVLARMGTGGLLLTRLPLVPVMLSINFRVKRMVKSGVSTSAQFVAVLRSADGLS
eukprot:1516115-Amphidinium_carterae.1